MIRALLLLLPIAAQAQTAQEIVARYLDASGGAEALNAIRTMKVTGTIGFGQDAPGPIVVTAARSAKLRAELTINRTLITQVYDGKSGWSDGRQIAGVQLDRLRDQAENAIGGPVANPRNKVELAGRTKWKDRDVFKMKVTHTTGAIMNVYLDATTYLEAGEELFMSVDGTETTISQNFSDYRRFGGVLFPCLIEGSSQRLKTTQIEINTPVEESAFLPR